MTPERNDSLILVARRARKELMYGNKVWKGQILTDGRWMRVIQVRISKNQVFGKYINDGNWYELQDVSSIA